MTGRKNRAPVLRSFPALLFLAALMLACSRETASMGEAYTLAPDLRFTATATQTATNPIPSPTLTRELIPTQTQPPTLGSSITPRSTRTYPPTPTHKQQATPLPVAYFVQSGDTLRTVAIRFGVLPGDIRSVDGEDLPQEGLLDLNTRLIIPIFLTETSDPAHLFPDSAIVYSPTFIRFNPVQFIRQQGGYLSSYIEGSGAIANGPEILRQIAFNNSFSPKLLLALLEYSSGWVTQPNPSQATRDYPLGYRDPASRGLHDQLIWATNILSIGYYGWRDASLVTLSFADGETLRLAPDLNAGTVAILYYFSRATANRSEWAQAVQDFQGVYDRMFGDPFDQAVEPLYLSELPDIEMELPFAEGQMWSFTGGPHGAWEHDGARAALDFAPTDSVKCAESGSWVTASVPGLIVRSIGNVVVIDVDGDGHEETGWNILYLHIANKDHISQGARVEIGDRLGHPSCEGGIATGAHVHMARKFNGEWMLAGGPVPFVLSGWVATAGDAPYEGTLVRGGQVAVARSYGSNETLVWR